MTKYIDTTAHSILGVGFLYLAAIGASKYFALVLGLGFIALAIHSARS